MKQVAVLSGKGGTGKTSLVAACHRVANIPMVLADCDVDAANLALTVSGEVTADEPFFGMEKARVNPEACTGCGVCLDVCRFGAVSMTRTGASIDPLLCEGCRACSIGCPSEAISLVEHEAGRIFVHESAANIVVHAALGIGEGNSGKLAALVRSRAQQAAETSGRSLILIDGPPGIGCPVHATLNGVDLIVGVTEPTLSGASDLIRLLKLATHFGIHTMVVVNKYDLSIKMTEQIEDTAVKNGGLPIGRIGFDDTVPKELAQHPKDFCVSSFDAQIKTVWKQIWRRLS